MTDFPTFETLIKFILIMLRMTAFMWFFPLFGKQPSTRYAKLGLSFFLSLPLTFVVAFESGSLQLDISLLLLALQEVSVGLIMGFMVFLLEGILRTAGTFISQLVGLEASQILAPGSSHTSSVLSVLCFYLGIIILLTLDGHHFLIQALALSFDIIPPGHFVLRSEVIHLIFKEWYLFWRFLILLAAPFIMLFFAITTELGILGRMVPQMNIFLMEYPIRIGSGILLLAWFLPTLATGLSHLCLILKDILSAFIS